MHLKPQAQAPRPTSYPPPPPSLFKLPPLSQVDAPGTAPLASTLDSSCFLCLSSLAWIAPVRPLHILRRRLPGPWFAVCLPSSVVLYVSSASGPR